MSEAAAAERPAVEPAALERARRLTLRYTVAWSAILLVAGALGIVLRDSQADVGRIDPMWWYALMTAHGLGAFLGWAGFAVMGFSWWILAKVGFPLRRFGALMAEATFWLMVAGVAGVVLTTLVFHFGGLWVFLYPLPFHGAGDWGRWTTFFFSASVLSVGLSIVTWCLGVLDTVIGPALHAVRTGVANRLGVAMGFGFLWPQRFATNPRPVPYAVIPLTVIAIDMIIATLPLAVLLVEMMVQSLSPGVTVDPLLAKNVLWWFGHPVVYLLLFPAVAIYYYLIPRYAGRPLVAGRVIAIAWTVAVIANVLVWAHHVYLDYPQGSVQGAINTAMQPMTFALVIPSALSLYSLGFTIYRSNFEWTAAAHALFLGMVSWLLAGLSGIVNATIDFDQVVHNTLWIVGHFHQMALLNIGFVVFAGVYAFLPELVGKPLYSERLAKWHLHLTFWTATLNSALWLVQGLQGGPRRFAVLPGRYDSLAIAAVPVVLVLALAQLLFVWNLVQTLRGVQPRERALPELGLAAGLAVPFVLLAAGGAGGAIGWAAGRGGHHGAGTVSTAGGAPAAPGLAVFQSAGCGGCHTLAAAHASGTIGPNLDRAAPSAALVVDRVTHGKGAMPSFQGRLSPEQIRQVADFVASRGR